MRVYVAELICSTGVLGFQIFNLSSAYVYNKLRSHAEILSWWAFDVTFPKIQPSEVQSVKFERE